MSIIKDFQEFKANKKREATIQNYFKLMNGYNPVFTSFEGGIYEYELTRSAIHCIATHCAKFKPEIIGSREGNTSLNNIFQFQANPLMNTYQYLYKLTTLLMIKNTAFILPIYSNDRLTGFYPVDPQFVELVLNQNNEYGYKFNLQSGTLYMPSNDVGVLNQYLYSQDTFGETNTPLLPTIQMLDSNRQGIVDGIKNSAYVRFVAVLAQAFNEEKMKDEQKRLRSMNLQSDNENGIFMIDSKYKDLKQIESKPYTINAVQQREIEDNVFSYFGVNKDILQNNFNSNTWNAFYEGKLESIAIQMSLAHSNLVFSQREIAFGNRIMFTTDREQYLAPTEKLEIFKTLFDRGAMNANQGAELFNRPGNLPNGDKYYKRAEYIELERKEMGTDEYSN